MRPIVAPQPVPVPHHPWSDRCREVVPSRSSHCLMRPRRHRPCRTTPTWPPAGARTCHGLADRAIRSGTDRTTRTTLAPRLDRETRWHARKAARAWPHRHSVRPDRARRSARRRWIRYSCAHAPPWRAEDYPAHDSLSAMAIMLNADLGARRIGPLGCGASCLPS